MRGLARLALYVAFYASLALLVYAGYTSCTASAQVVEVNVTNESVLVSFHNMTVINFTTTHVSLGWANSTFIEAVYSCIYAQSIDECHPVEVDVYNASVLVYTAKFTDMNQLCSLNGLCFGKAYFDVSGISMPRVIVKDLRTGQVEGPVTMVWPYRGPKLTGYAAYIPVIVGYGLLFGLAGRLSLKNIGIGLLIFGAFTPAFSVLGLGARDIGMVMVISIVLGLMLIWFSGQ